MFTTGPQKYAADSHLSPATVYTSSENKILSILSSLLNCINNIYILVASKTSLDLNFLVQLNNWLL